MIGRRPWYPRHPSMSHRPPSRNTPARVQSSGPDEALVMQYCIVCTQVWLTIFDFPGGFDAEECAADWLAGFIMRPT
ncbi:hypothetical protein LY78DRAFT_66673 [Colletotrichum sublineola]|nr:hypothetical protein LY78DRAFT_66673 [Colletotrichum sublineola]